MEDERPYVAWETPTRLTAINPRAEPRQCTQCLPDVKTFYPADTVVIVKHHHRGQPLGHLTTHCPEHPPGREWVGGDHEAGHVNRTGETCPSCFVQMPLSGVCHTCG